MANKKGWFFYTAIFMVVLMIVSFLALLSGESEDGLRLFIAAVGGFTFLFLFARIGPDVKDEKRKFMQCTVECTGVVVDVESEKHMSNNSPRDILDIFFARRTWYTYSPVIQYDVNGCTYKGKANISNTENVFQAGQSCQILVNPANSSEFVVKGTRRSVGWVFFLAIFLLLGLGCLAYYCKVLLGDVLNILPRGRVDDYYDYYIYRK